MVEHGGIPCIWFLVARETHVDATGFGSSVVSRHMLAELRAELAVEISVELVVIYFAIARKRQ